MFSSGSTFVNKLCTDPVVGGILAGWRYDISGLAPDMRGDYERHFADCVRCRARQRLHRRIDVGLIVLASLSAVVFLVAFGAVRWYAPRHALLLEIGALAGFVLSGIIWVLVAVSTPAPNAVAEAALVGARRVHERLPGAVRDRLPEEIKVKISATPPSSS